jgi:hypothetical protein
MTRCIIVLFLLASVPGCCRFAKRSCFPACPPPRLVKLEKPCELPPALSLRAVSRVPCDGAADIAVACYDAYGAAGIAVREAAMKDWIREARARCGVKGPASQPSSTSR